MEEIKVAENAEELKAKDYALALERMQNSLKREKQIKIVKTMNEKNKSNVNIIITLLFKMPVLEQFLFSFQNNKKGFISQLQNSVQRSDFINVEYDQNIPESWKWENQANVRDKKERKGKNRKWRSNKSKHMEETQ